MVKFLIALAELFSSFSAKLHDMSENVVEMNGVTTTDVKNMIDDALGNDVVIASDVKGLTRFIENVITDTTFQTHDIENLEEFVMSCVPNPENAFQAQMRRQKCMEVIMQYSAEYNLHYKIDLDNEVERLNRHMLDRITAWASIDPKI